MSTLQILDQLDDRMGLLVDRVAVEFAATHYKIGSLPALNTTSKANVVSAVNEVKADLAALDTEFTADLSLLDGGNF